MVHPVRQSAAGQLCRGGHDPARARPVRQPTRSLRKACVGFLTPAFPSTIVWAGASGIMEAEVGENYQPLLTMLSRKIAFVREREGQGIPAIDMVAPEVERLRLKVGLAQHMMALL